MIDVDRAWDRLHTRLVDERLIDRTAKRVVMPFIAKIKLVAAIVALCVVGGAIGLYLNAKNEKIAHPYLSIHNGDIFNTLVTMLDDGSIVYLAGGATLTCPERFVDNKRRVTLHGDALFDVYSDAGSPFVIETEPVVVEVLGTTFNIKAADNHLFELSVHHGLVKVIAKATGAHLFVEAGETVRLIDRQQLLKEPSHSPQQITHFAENMRFKDERLENIVHVINRMSHKPICISDNELKDSEITIAFDNNTVEEMIALLCVILDLKYSDDGKEIVIGR